MHPCHTPFLQNSCQYIVFFSNVCLPSLFRFYGKCSVHFLCSMPISSSCFLFFLLSKYFPQHIFLQPFFLGWDQISHACIKTDKILLPYNLIFKCSERRGKNNGFQTGWQKEFCIFIVVICKDLIFFTVVHKYFSFVTLLKNVLHLFILWIHPEFWWKDMTLSCIVLSFLCIYFCINLYTSCTWYVE